MNSELIHEVEERDLVLDLRIHDRRVLEPVPERLVVELDPGQGTPIERALTLPVPIVDDVELVHGHFVRGLSSRAGAFTELDQS